MERWGKERVGFELGARGWNISEKQRVRVVSLSASVIPTCKLGFSVSVPLSWRRGGR